MSTHTCPAPGCSREVSDDLLACRQHWYELPKPLRDALWRAFNDHGRGSPAHTAAVDACLRAFERGTNSAAQAPTGGSQPLTATVAQLVGALKLAADAGAVDGEPLTLQIDTGGRLWLRIGSGELTAVLPLGLRR
jgi:hypothetical protein